MDLELYASDYEGNTKLSRLHFIANQCPPLQIEAFRMCYRELKKSGTRPELERDVALKLQTAWWVYSDVDCPLMTSNMPHTLCTTH